MELTDDQVRAAKGSGYAFFPATESQLHRFTVQRRIFGLGGKPFVISRDGSFYETHGTFSQVLEQFALPAAEPAPAAVVEQPMPAPEPVVAAEAPAEIPAEVAAEPAPEPSSTRLRLRRPRVVVAEAEPPPAPPVPLPPRPHASEAAAAAEAEQQLTPAAMAAMAQDEAADLLAELADPEHADSGAQVIRRARPGPAGMRWATAGAARRGRLKSPKSWHG